MSEKKHQKKLLKFLMLALVSVVSVLMAAGASFAAMDCSSCHGDGVNPATGQLRAGTDMRPVDSAYRNISTGGVVGSHGKHMTVQAPATLGSACVVCHNNAGYTAAHRSGIINLSAGVSYNKGAGNITFTNQTSVPVLGTCATASCHVSPVSTTLVVTPTWGTAAGCVSCHAGANVITANGPATGSHTNTAGHAAACTSCHAAGTTATTYPTTGHIDGNIDVANVGYLTLNKTKGTAGTTCSAASCHASPVNSTLITTPAWGTTGNGCAACHSGANAITATGPATGSHALAGHAAACTSCHAAGTTSTTVPSTGHADGDIDVASVGYATLNKAKGTAGVTCSAASCHASPVAATLVLTPAWGTTGNGCAACHSGVNAITATGPATGSHALTGHAAACTSCHAAGTTATTVPSTGHNDGNIDVANVGYLTLNKTKGTAGTTCSAASCHASPVVVGGFTTTPAWGTAGNGCAACHSGANAITATGPATGSHALAGHAAACTSCHAAGTTATTVPSTGHNDGDIDVASVGYATLNKTKGTAGVTCSAASCHASPVTGTLVLTPAWGSTGNGCAACHSGVNAITATGPATGSHALAGHAAACTSCHAAGTTATTVPSTGHNDGNIDVANVGYLTLNKTKGTAGTTCSAATCHASPVVVGGFTVTPAWGTAGSGCAACHSGANAITATGPATGSHALAGHAAACTSCHAAGTTATTVPSTGHNDGDIDVASVGYATLNKTKGTAGTTCSSASCHASPVAVGGFTVTPAWGTTGAGCVACHSGANAIAATGPATGYHVLHMSRAGVTCVKCHNAGTTATTVPTTGHNNGNVDVANVGYPVNVTKHAAGSGYATCSTSCHNSPAGYSPAFTAPALTWGVNANCNGCHGYPPTAGTNHIGVTGDVCFSCHGNVKNTTTTTTSSAAAFNVPANHMDGVVQGGRCDACHGYPPVRSLVGRGTNLTYSSAKLQNYSGGGGVHDVAGHLPTTLKTSQNLGFSACVTCHPSTSHNQAAVSGFGGFSTQFVQVVVDPKFKFDKNRPIVYNAKQSGTGKTTGTCANVACHFQKSPNWSSEAYTQGH